MTAAYITAQTCSICQYFIVTLMRTEIAVGIGVCMTLWRWLTELHHYVMGSAGY